jgi:hypothetical protein
LSGRGVLNPDIGAETQSSKKCWDEDRSRILKPPDIFMMFLFGFLNRMRSRAFKSGTEVRLKDLNFVIGKCKLIQGGK